MKIEIIKDKLLWAITNAERVVGKHSSIPIISNILIETKNDGVMIKATNLDLGLELFIPCKVLEEGLVAIQGAVLKSFLSTTLKEKNINLWTEGDVLNVLLGQNKASIKTVPSEDFPIIPKVVDSEGSFLIKSEEFVFGVDSVWWSASEGVIKPELSSVYIYEEKGEIVFVATDSFRLSERRVISKKEKGIKGILIPSKNVAVISSLLKESPGELNIRTTPNQISIIHQNFHITSRLIEGNFPDYKQIIPKEFSTKVTLLKEDLINTLKTSSTFSDKFHQVILDFDTNEKLLKIETKNNLVGESIQFVKASISGKPLKITFNYKYILDSLSVIENESISFELSGVGKPLVIRGVHNESFMYLVMPMNR